MNSTPRQPRPSDVTVETYRYEFSHRKAPRGYGGWMFEDAAYNVVFQQTSSYADARRAAQVWAAQNGVDRVFACP